MFLFFFFFFFFFLRIERKERKEEEEKKTPLGWSWLREQTMSKMIKPLQDALFDKPELLVRGLQSGMPNDRLPLPLPLPRCLLGFGDS